MGHDQRCLTSGIAGGSILGLVLCEVSDPVMERAAALERTRIRLAEDTVWGTQMIFLRTGLPHRQPWGGWSNGTMEMEIQQ